MVERSLIEAANSAMRFAASRAAITSAEETAIMGTLRAALDATPETYAHFQQRRGRFPDLIEEAILIYDEWMKDDDYNARGCLDKVIAKLESARDWYDKDRTALASLDAGSASS